MISVFILPSNIIFWKTESESEIVPARKERERERGRRESPLLATHELQLRWRPRDFAPRTHELVFDFTHMPRAQIMPRTQSLRLHRKPTNRSLSLCDFDFCCCCGGVGGGVLVVFLLCGGGLCLLAVGCGF